MSDTTDAQLRTRLLLAIQRALWGAVTPNLRCVYVNLVDKQVYCTFVYEKEVSAVEREAASVAGTEVIADFEEGYTIDDRIVVSDAPGKQLNEMFSGQGYLLAYLRME